MLIAGNWKMNTDLVSARQLAGAVRVAVGDPGEINVAVCPPFVSLDGVFGTLHGSGIRLGAQTMHAADSGAFTGEISAPMLSSLGCYYVILGHSERRQYFGETDESVNGKVKKALSHRLVPIVCVGETLNERDGDIATDVVKRQVVGGLADVEIADASKLVVAYEPIWAIGTGRTASPGQAQEMHAVIRGLLGDRFGSDIGSEIEILYGGSMKPGNAEELLRQEDVNGGLIGGASLKADDFGNIVDAARAVLRG